MNLRIQLENSQSSLEVKVYNYNYKVSKTLLKMPQIVICPAYSWSRRLQLMFSYNFFYNNLQIYLYHPFFIVKFSHSLWPGLSPNLVSSYIALNLFGHSQGNVFISHTIQNTGSNFFINRLSVLQPGSRTQFCKNLRKKHKKKYMYVFSRSDVFFTLCQLE